MSPEVRALTEVARCIGAASPAGRARTPATPGKPRRITKIRWCGPGRRFPTSPSKAMARCESRRGNDETRPYGRRPQADAGVAPYGAPPSLSRAASGQPPQASEIRARERRQLSFWTAPRLAAKRPEPNCGRFGRRIGRHFYEWRERDPVDVPRLFREERPRGRGLEPARAAQRPDPDVHQCRHGAVQERLHRR